MIVMLSDILKRKQSPSLATMSLLWVNNLNWHRSCFSASGGKHQPCDSESYLSFLNLNNDKENGWVLTQLVVKRYLWRLWMGSLVCYCYWWVLLLESTWGSDSFHSLCRVPQVRLWACLFLHGRALSGHASTWQPAGPDHWWHHWLDLLDLCHIY